MFQVRKPQTGTERTIAFLALLYHSTVRAARRSGGRNALLGLLGNMMQTLVFIGAFFLFFQLMGRGMAQIRGDFLLYIMSGVFIFMTHTKTVGAVSGAEGPTSAMMNHAPMNTMIATFSAAFSELYNQLLTLFVVMFLYHVAVRPIEAYDPVSALGMVLLAWLSGVAVGMVVLAIRPFYPSVAKIGSTVYQRVNMIASGKMFVANSMPSVMISLFDWNPLFHIIDQTRGYLFINYTPHKTSETYALYFSLIFIVIGLMGEFYARKYASASWAHRQL